VRCLESGKSAAKVYEIDPLGDSRWNALVDSHPDASVFHTAGWLRALRTVYGYEPFAVTTCAPGAALTNALVLCRIKSWLTGRRLVSLPFSDHCEALVSRPEELNEMLLHIKQSVGAGGWGSVEIRPITHQPGSHVGLGAGASYQFHRLDLRKSAPELFQAFHKDCVQRKIRRAEREGLKYEEGTSEALLRKFYKLVVVTRRRQYLPPQPIAWFRGLISALGNDLRIRIASQGDLPVAGILTLSHKRRIVYKYGGSIASLNKLGGMVFLFWKTIQEAKSAGFEELDFGRSDNDNPGLIAFKEHWGTTGTTLRYWTYPSKPQGQRSGWQKRLAQACVGAMPDSALEAIGGLLYKHIG
jgi:CelD/BcsL family acetyltransferase involved in cellulose biosynthesis